MSLCGLSIAVFLVNIIITSTSGDAKWAYNSKGGLEAPNAWSHVSKYCDSGSFRQSPINIDTTKSLQINEHNVCAPKMELDWNVIGYRQRLLATNNGHSLSLTPISAKDNKIKKNKRENTIGELINWWNVKANINENEFFCLNSFHFHWGSNDNEGSEHTIDGKRYPLEIHWVHYSCDYDDITGAIGDWQNLLSQNKDPFVLGVVGIFFEIGEENPALETILSKAADLKESGKTAIIDNVNLYDLIPSDGLRYYYTYLGSLTTPPCTPIVKWHILENTLTVSQDQINRFRKLRNSLNEPEAPNFRPIQKNTPKEFVYECIEK